jgi:predicted outer membrane protein
MLKPTHFLAAGAAVALLLAAPVAHAQTTAFAAASTEEVASIRPDASAEAVRNLSAPAEFTTDAYYDDSHKDLRQTLAWMQETNALHPAYHTMYAEARIRLQLKDYAGAHTTAIEAKKLALAAANSDYARRSEEVMTKAKAHGI